MICKTCAFNTARAFAKEWHAMCQLYPDLTQLPEIIQSILTPRVTRYLPDHWQGPFPEDRLSRWIEERDQEGTILLVVEADSVTPIGFLTLFESTEEGLPGLVVRFGYVIGEDFWGRGLATELVQGFIHWSRHHHVSKIVSGVDTRNPGSIRVLEKCGFARLEQHSNQDPEIQHYELCVPQGP